MPLKTCITVSKGSIALIENHAMQMNRKNKLLGILTQNLPVLLLHAGSVNKQQRSLDEHNDTGF